VFTVSEILTLIVKVSMMSRLRKNNSYVDSKYSADHDPPSATCSYLLVSKCVAIFTQRELVIAKKLNVKWPFKPFSVMYFRTNGKATWD